MIEYEYAFCPIVGMKLAYRIDEESYKSYIKGPYGNWWMIYDQYDVYGDYPDYLEFYPLAKAVDPNEYY